MGQGLFAKLGQGMSTCGLMEEMLFGFSVFGPSGSLSRRQWLESRIEISMIRYAFLNMTLPLSCMKMKCPLVALFFSDQRA